MGRKTNLNVRKNEVILDIEFLPDISDLIIIKLLVNKRVFNKRYIAIILSLSIVN